MAAVRKRQAGICALPALALLLTCGWSCVSSSESLAAVASSRTSSNLSAQTDLLAALKAARAEYRLYHDFSQAGPPELQQFDAKLTWLGPDIDAVATGRQVGVSNGGDNTNQTVTLAAVSSTGTCWYLVDVARSDSETLTGGSGIHSAGVWYAHENHAASTCNAPDNGPPGASTLSSRWNHHSF
jgi:hypothetical protein